MKALRLGSSAVASLVVLSGFTNIYGIAIPALPSRSHDIDIRGSSSVGHQGGTPIETVQSLEGLQVVVCCQLSSGARTGVFSPDAFDFESLHLPTTCSQSWREVFMWMDEEPEYGTAEVIQRTAEQTNESTYEQVERFSHSVLNGQRRSLLDWNVWSPSFIIKQWEAVKSLFVSLLLPPRDNCKGRIFTAKVIGHDVAGPDRSRDVHLGICMDGSFGSSKRGTVEETSCTQMVNVTLVFDQGKSTDRPSFFSWLPLRMGASEIAESKSFRSVLVDFLDRQDGGMYVRTASLDAQAAQLNPPRSHHERQILRKRGSAEVKKKHKKKPRAAFLGFIVLGVFVLIIIAAIISSVLYFRRGKKRGLWPPPRPAISTNSLPMGARRAYQQLNDESQEERRNYPNIAFPQPTSTPSTQLYGQPPSEPQQYRGPPQRPNLTVDTGATPFRP